MKYDLITLRRLHLGDTTELAQLANNRKIWLSLRDRFPHPYTYDDAVWYVNYALENDKEIIRGITCDDQLVGVIGVILLDDVYKQTGDIGYWIGEPYWNKGITTKALLLFIQMCKDSLGLKRLEAGVFSTNIGSMRVLEKCGFEEEGIRKSKIIKDGQTLDEHSYGLVL